MVTAVRLDELTLTEPTDGKEERARLGCATFRGAAEAGKQRRLQRRHLRGRRDTGHFQGDRSQEKPVF